MSRTYTQPSSVISHLLLASCLFALTCVSSGQLAAEEPSGRWKGRWISGTSGHSGPMRARVTPNGDGSYRVLFTGRFAVVIPFAYRAELQPLTTCSGTSYVVDKKLGPILGSYRMHAVVPGNSFNANYSAAGDSGQINMQRQSY